LARTEVPVAPSRTGVRGRVATGGVSKIWGITQQF